MDPIPLVPSRDSAASTASLTQDELDLLEFQARLSAWEGTYAFSAPLVNSGTKLKTYFTLLQFF